MELNVFTAIGIINHYFDFATESMSLRYVHMNVLELAVENFYSPNYFVMYSESLL